MKHLSRNVHWQQKEKHLFDKFLAKSNCFARKARPYVPFTELNTVWRHIDEKAKTILDVGCGMGEPMRFINRHNRYLCVGVDIFKPSLEACRTLGIYSDLVLCDVNYLPFKEKSFDVVLCTALIEHLEKEEGEKLLRQMEQTARKQVILSTPVGKYKQGALEGNPHQEHRYIWKPDALKDRGYKVRGVGIRGVMGEGALFSRLVNVIGGLRWIPWLLAGPFVYFVPKLAGTQVCWKRTNTLG